LQDHEIENEEIPQAQATCHHPFDIPVFITSHRGEQLQDGSKTAKMSRNKRSWEKWTITHAGSGEVFITGCRGRQLMCEENGTVHMSENKQGWEKWTITNAGSGKVFITSRCGKQLIDDKGTVHMSENKRGWEKWTITTADGAKVYIPEAPTPISTLSTTPAPTPATV